LITNPVAIYVPEKSGSDVKLAVIQLQKVVGKSVGLGDGIEDG